MKIKLYLNYRIIALFILTLCYGCSGCSEETTNNDVSYADVADVQVSDVTTTDIEKNDPCKGVDCSGHGVCAVINNEKAVCICDKGYEQDPKDPTVCKPVTCTPDCKDKECGNDGCGGECGKCNTDEFCNSEYKCVKKGPGCPDTKDCSNRECGPDPVCGESCGVCGDDKMCNAQGKCVCKPYDSCEKALLAAGIECGEVDDGCGKKMDCRNVCKPPETCGGGGVPNKCGNNNCQTPYTNCLAALAAAGVECGVVPDGCGGTMDCTYVCNYPLVCGGIEPNKCGDPCKLAGDPPCSGHGMCQVDGKQAVCYCEFGYVANGLSCIAEVPKCQEPCPLGNFCDKSSGTCKPLPIQTLDLDRGNLFATINKIIVTQSGDIVVGGFLAEKNQIGQLYFETFQAFLAKFDSNLNKRWEKIWDINKKVDLVSDLAVDRDGNIYTVGASDSAYSTGGGKIDLIKWNSDGTKIAEFSLNEYLGEIEGSYYTPVPVHIVLGQDGSIYISGSYNRTDASGIGFDSYLMKLKINGKATLEWKRVIEKSSVFRNSSKLLIDDAGNLYLTGNAQADVLGTSNYSGGLCTGGCGGSSPCYDVFVASLTSNNSVRWVKVFGKANLNDSPTNAFLMDNLLYIFWLEVSAGPRYDNYLFQSRTENGLIIKSLYIPNNIMGVAGAGDWYSVGTLKTSYDGNRHHDPSGQTNDVLLVRWTKEGEKIQSWILGSDIVQDSEYPTAVASGGSPFKIYVAGTITASSSGFKGGFFYILQP